MKIWQNSINKLKLLSSASCSTEHRFQLFGILFISASAYHSSAICNLFRDSCTCQTLIIQPDRNISSGFCLPCCCFSKGLSAFRSKFQLYRPHLDICIVYRFNSHYILASQNDLAIKVIAITENQLFLW